MMGNFHLHKNILCHVITTFLTSSTLKILEVINSENIFIIYFAQAINGLKIEEKNKTIQARTSSICLISLWFHCICFYCYLCINSINKSPVLDLSTEAQRIILGNIRSSRGGERKFCREHFLSESCFYNHIIEILIIYNAHIWIRLHDRIIQLLDNDKCLTSLLRHLCFHDLSIQNGFQTIVFVLALELFLGKRKIKKNLFGSVTYTSKKAPATPAQCQPSPPHTYIPQTSTKLLEIPATQLEKQTLLWNSCLSIM